MREVVLQMSVSLDGFVAGPHGGVGGSNPEDGAQTSWKLERLRETDVHIMGRVTYEEMAAYWPSGPAPYAPLMNSVPKVVFSSTLTDASWPQTRVARGELAGEIAKLKQQPGKGIMAHGGAAFVQALSRHGLIDEYRVVIQPVALGAGLPLFKDLPAALRLSLVEARHFETGAVGHVYRPLRA